MGGGQPRRDLPIMTAPTLEPIAWSWVIGALSLAVVGIIIASAFATSARRQLTTIGQLSANGARPGLVRRTLVLQGAWSGLIGASIGVGAGLVALHTLHGLADRVIARHLGAYDLRVVDLVGISLAGVIAATIAAVVPARTASRVPVAAALAGRRPAGAVPRRLVPVGLALFVAGLFLLAVAGTGSVSQTGGPLFAIAAIAGGLGVLAGMCCLTPLGVNIVGRAGAQLTPSGRLSARSIARTRTRSAAVITAVATAAPLAIGASTYVTSRQAEAARNDALTISPYPKNAVIITDNKPPIGATDTPGFIDYTAPRAGGPGTRPRRFHRPCHRRNDARTRRIAIWNPAPEPLDHADTDTDGTPINLQGQLIVADPLVLDMLGMSTRDHDQLRAVGAASVLEPGVRSITVGTTETRLVDIEGVGKRRYQVTGICDRLTSYAGVVGTIVTPDTATALGLHIVDEAAIVIAPTDLNDDQLTRLQYIAGTTSELTPFDRPAGGSGGAEYVRIEAPSPAPPSSANAVRRAIVLAALLFTLLVVTIGLSLTAAESRDERDVLIAIGARPRTMRRTAALKAGVLALVGGILAVPTGVLPIAVLLRALRRPDTLKRPLAIDWLTITAVVALIPITVAVAATASAAVSQRVRPPRMSTLHRD